MDEAMKTFFVAVSSLLIAAHTAAAVEIKVVTGVGRYTRQPGGLVLVEDGSLHASKVGFSPGTTATYPEADLNKLGIPSSTIAALDGKTFVGDWILGQQSFYPDFNIGSKTYPIPFPYPTGKVVTISWKGAVVSKPPVASVKVTKPVVFEKNRSSTFFEFSIDQAQGKPLDIAYKISGTAEDGDFITSQTGRVRIPTGKTSARVKLTAVKDRDKSRADRREKVTFTIESFTLYKVGKKRAATVVINGD